MAKTCSTTQCSDADRTS